MTPRITIQFEEEYSANFEFADQIDTMIRQVVDAPDPQTVGRWIAVLGSRQLKYEDWNHHPPIRLILYFNVEGGRPVLQGLLGPNNWSFLT